MPGNDPVRAPIDERARLLVPRDRDRREGALLVAVRDAVVLVQLERGVGARVHPQRERIVGLLARVLDLRAHRQDRAALHVERDGLVGRRARRCAGRPRAAAGPEVVPTGPPARVVVVPAGQVDGARGRARLRHRVHEQRRAEQELVADAEHLGVLAEVHHQRTHDRGVAPRDVAGDRVQVRQQAVAEPVERQHACVYAWCFSSPPKYHISRVRELAVHAQEARRTSRTGTSGC